MVGGLEEVTKSYHELREKAAYDEVRCGVCKAMAHETKTSIAKASKNTMKLDMRGRIDSKGNRQGKVVDYALSETRMLEVLDGTGDEGTVCKRLESWSIVRVPFGTEGFKALAVQK